MSPDGADSKDETPPVVVSRGLRRLQRRVAFLNEALKPAHPLRIADVGANPINTPTYANLLDLGGCEVWGFEPEETAFAALQENPKAGAHYVNKAVGRTGKGTFHHHPQTGLGSLFPIRKESVVFLGRPGWYRENGETSDIDLVSLDNIKELPQIDLLKIDIQGGELDVMETGRKKLADAVCIIPEVRFYRIYENEPLWGALDRELHDQGFVLHKLDFAKSTVIGNSQRARMRGKRFRSQLIDGDAIYIRNPETAADWSADQLHQLALASCTVFESFDLTVFCLDQLVERELIAADVPEQFVDLLPPWMMAGT